MISNRRHFFKQLAGIGLFAILPGAGRVWKAEAVITTSWSEEQILLYNKLPYFLVEGFRQDFGNLNVWRDLLDKVKFQ